MSRNSKNARLIKEAKERSAARQNGTKGPERTQAKHGKTKAWWQVGDRTYKSFVKGKPKRGNEDQVIAGVVAA